MHFKHVLFMALWSHSLIVMQWAHTIECATFVSLVGEIFSQDIKLVHYKKCLELQIYRHMEMIDFKNLCCINFEFTLFLG